MFKSKSFDLVNEEKAKKRERLYQPRRMRWLKYIILPAVFSFALLLILVNVDFSDNNDEVTSNSTDLGSESTYSKNKCVDQWNTSLLISSYEFENNTLERGFFCGCFELLNFTIENSTITHISNGTFDQNSTSNLLSLQLINVQLESLSHLALQGLQKLQNFTLINGNNAFKPHGFLSALAKTVIQAKIHQHYSTEIIYSFSDFLGPLNFTQLKWLDLSGTNFGETFSADSFENLPVLEELILNNCGLRQMKWETIPITLKMLPPMEILGHTPETIINNEKGSTVKAEAASNPQLVGTSPQVTSSTRPTVTWSTEEVTPEPETSTVDESGTQYCDEDLCQELICNLYSGSVDQENSTSCEDGILVELCESDCSSTFNFCVALDDNFNSSIGCCSNRTTKCVTSTQVTWYKANRGLVIGLGVGIFFIGLFLGVVSVYLTIRLKPSWCSDADKGRRDSNTMGLFAPKSEKDRCNSEGIPISTLDNNEYITAYHRYLEQANHRPTESNKYICPPRDRAPSVPPSSIYNCRLPLPLPLPERNNNIYESCELYEELP
ncbi:uncharacterized protein LOC108140999 [Drosophila elegans]|uniref:uncharacterized protein LOC108140999 n=1 Tax=Drosophila elegans TaxID=30023 RepID=UPI0007E74734|nr:uncharacterized protein LOC108140999 [Drosophila elegans]